MGKADCFKPTMKGQAASVIAETRSDWAISLTFDDRLARSVGIGKECLSGLIFQSIIHCLEEGANPIGYDGNVALALLLGTPAIFPYDGVGPELGTAVRR